MPNIPGSESKLEKMAYTWKMLFDNKIKVGLIWRMIVVIGTNNVDGYKTI